MTTSHAHSVIYQSAKLKDTEYLLTDFELAHHLITDKIPVGRIYGSSAGALAAIAHGIVLSARAAPDRFTPEAAGALTEFEAFFRRAVGRRIYRLNWRGLKYGFFNLDPLRRWLAGRLRAYTGLEDISSFTLADLALPVYLCVTDRDAYPVFFGPENPELHFAYHNCTIRTENGPLLDALIAALSTLLRADAYPVNGHYYKDGRPVFADISAMVLDMESADPRPVIKSRPYTDLPAWPSNAVTQPFIMHRWHERNQADLAVAYDDLLLRHRDLKNRVDALVSSLDACGLGDLVEQHFTGWQDRDRPEILHIRLPYIGTTEAGANMRESIAHKHERMQVFHELGEPQLTGFDFNHPLTLIYGAGGFSGILAGMVMTRLIDARSSSIKRVFGCSSGVLNGLFHGVALGARQHPDLYTPAALDALDHLEEFFDQLTPAKVFQINWWPYRVMRAVANLNPLRDRLIQYLEYWTGRSDGAAITFEEIKLPFYAVAARGSDGYMDFFGMPDDLAFDFAGRRMRPINCPIVDAIVGGMAQPFYITPPLIQGETYFDGGAAFYDFDLFAAGMERDLSSLVSIHVVGPPDYSFGFDERPTIIRTVLDTHNFTFPEARRRMTRLADLFYDHEALRRRTAHLVSAARAAGHGEILADHPLPGLADPWWQNWKPRQVGLWPGP